MMKDFDPWSLLARCVLCGRGGSPLCAPCRPTAFPSAWASGGERVHAIGPYAGVLADCVRRLKYGDETHLAFALGRALRHVAERAGRLDADTLILPIPLHPLRLAERGYNQTALIARALVRSGGARVRTDVLFRREARAAQARLSAEERRTNLCDAFEARRPRAAFASVLLLDDVMTTGSTIDACARALERVGIHVAGALTCAIAGSQPEREEGGAPQQLLIACS